MRILFVLHDFLPAHPSGTEVYAAALARRLAERGHEVRIFATEKDIRRAHLALEKREWEGLVVHELVNNLFYRDFRETWDFPPAVEALEAVLDEYRPEVVHVMHLLYLSVGCVELAHRRGIPVFFTLNDYWLQCARFGQRVHADGAICHTIDFARCGTCLARLKYAQSPLERRAARVIAAVKRFSGIDLSPVARATEGWLPSRSSAGTPARSSEDGLARVMAEAMARREAELRARLVPCVTRFFAPSRFLRDRFLEWGLPPEQVEVLGYGLELDPFRGFHRSPSERVRVAFIGTLAPHKAPHLLLGAWSRLPPGLAGRARLTIHGPKNHYPEYVQGLERSARALGAVLPGSLGHENLPAALSEIDLLVVPSVWYENSPMTIHEARATRTPVLVSDLGGMAELVEPGRSGWRFRPGDEQDLAEKLAGILRAPEQLSRLDFGGEPVKDMRTSAGEMEERYRAALARGGRAGSP